MIPFVCVREGRENYRSLTQDHISIHPGSSMFKTNPVYIVAGEIVRTSRMFAMSVSPLTKKILEQISPGLEEKLNKIRAEKEKDRAEKAQAPKESKKKEKQENKKGAKKEDKKKDENTVSFGGESFECKKIKGKKTLLLPWNEFKSAASKETNESLLNNIAGMKGTILMKGGFKLLSGEKMEAIMKIAKTLNLNPIDEKSWPRKLNINIFENGGLEQLVKNIEFVMRITVAKAASKELGFVCLFTDGNGTYWFKVSRGFTTALNESLASLEKLIDDTKDSELDISRKEKINMLYRLLDGMYK